MEDNIVYTILILALFLLPTSVLITTSLDCTYCQQALCEENTVEDPGLQAYFVKKYCTYEADLSPIILYYPFILLVIATLLLTTHITRRRHLLPHHHHWRWHKP